MSFLKQLKRDTVEEDAAYAKLEKDLLKEHPTHLPLLSARLASINSVSVDLHPKKFEVCIISCGHQDCCVPVIPFAMGFLLNAFLMPAPVAGKFLKWCLLHNFFSRCHA